MTIIERLETELAHALKTTSVDTIVETADLSALLECVRALHAFVHTQTDSEAEIHVLTAARSEAEKKVGLG